MTTSHLLAEAKVPRYTSYPTAPHFSKAVTPRDYTQWLAALPSDTTLSLYLHIPFCRELCNYCGCFTKASRRSEPVERYAAVLRREIELIAGLAGSRQVTRIHWGGGTPSVLDSDLLTVHAALDRHFALCSLTEHAIELDPRVVDERLVERLVQIGINRASLGVQDVSPHVQQAIGRIQPPERVEAVVAALRAAGIGQLSFDFMYGLPRQTIDDVRANMEFARRLHPQRISLFGYAHVPWFRPHQRLIDASALPGAAERLEQAETARALLIEAGYQAIGIDHFALPDDELARAAREGWLRRNFQGYTTDDADALLGLGVSAIGQLPQGYVQNSPDQYLYSTAVTAGQPATARGLAFTDEDRLRARVIERLMCDLSVDLEAVAGGHAAALKAEFDNRIKSILGADGGEMLQVENSRIAVTDAGRPYLRLIASAFDTYLERENARHSVAV
ncbi:MAG: oxygen-independent coproporphyrinogen III oxidase [Bradyrhizobiaceae bacterium]|nr:oxygen-independent coproporphyrinogen III oxidase [Bradyrhizobiaceae bacterium]